MNIDAKVDRFCLVTRKPFEAVVKALDAKIGHPDMSRFQVAMAAAKNFGELEQIVQKAAGNSGLMEFARFNIGAVLRKESGLDRPQILRLLIGNPLVMKEMVKRVPEAASYAPVTVLIDERPDGVHLSYDRMASSLAPYGNAEALAVAKHLDAKIEALLRESAA